MLDELKNNCIQCFGSILVGIYLHGSYVLDDFHWESSDLDVIVVVSQTPDLQIKYDFLNKLLNPQKPLPAGGIELSVLLLKDTQHFFHPLPYVFHFSKMHEDIARENPRAYCLKMQGTDPDLACHLALIRQSGIGIYGKKIEEVFSTVPRWAYLDSVYQDLLVGDERFFKNPRYYLANMGRTLFYLRHNQIVSKGQGMSYLKKMYPNQNELKLWHMLCKEISKHLSRDML